MVQNLQQRHCLIMVAFNSICKEKQYDRVYYMVTFRSVYNWIKVMSNYKETHGSLKGFNREGKDVTHINVNDERTAELLEKACKKSHIPVDMKKVTDVLRYLHSTQIIF